MMGCGSMTTMGQGDEAVCGKIWWDKVYECQSCQIKRLTTVNKNLTRALNDARTIRLSHLVQALDDQQMLYGVTKNVVEGEIIDVVFALRDMGFKIDVPPEMEP